MAAKKGKPAGSISFSLKSFFEGVVRERVGAPFDSAPKAKYTIKRDGEDITVTIAGELETLKKNLKAEIGKDLAHAPDTKAVVDLFLAQMKKVVDPPKVQSPAEKQLADILAKKDDEIAKLRAQLAEMSTGKRKAG